MKVILTLHEQQLIRKYQDAREAFEAAKAEAGAVLVGICDGPHTLDCGMLVPTEDAPEGVEYNTLVGSTHATA